jgi:subtilisin family serine protease
MKRLQLFTTICVLSLLVVVIDTAQTSKAADRESKRFCQREVVVRLKPGVNISEINARYGTTVLEKIPEIEGYRLGWAGGSDTTQVVDEMAGDSNLFFATPNYFYRSPELLQQSVAFVDSTNPPYVSGQSPSPFYFQPQVLNLHLEEAQSYTLGGGVTVAVIDTGIDLNNPLFAGRITTNGFDFVDNDVVPNEEPDGPGYGHGTFISGLIRLVAPNAMIMPLRAFGQDGSATSFNIARAIRYAKAHGAKVINMSFGLQGTDASIRDAMNDVSQIVYMVASAGNDNQDSLHFPASGTSRTLAVAGTAAGDKKATFSNYSYGVRASAPSVNLYSAYPNNRWAYWSGTSFSTALVTGEAALLLSLRPGASRTLLNRTITDSGININELNPSYAGKLGRRIDYRAAVQLILSNL